MSFASLCKNEIISQKFNKDQLYEVALGMLDSTKIIERELHFQTTNLEVASFFEQRMNELSLSYQKIETKTNLHLEYLYIFSEEETDRILAMTENNQISGNESKYLSYLAGMFISKGSVNDPKTTKYHLEIAIYRSKKATFALSLINSHPFEFNVKIAKRKGKYIIYIKDAEKIVDVLRLLGANNNAFSFEDIRIERDFSNSINRLLNCEIANEKKALEAAREQLRYIKYLEYNYPLEKIDQKTLIVMKVRKDNPEATFLELITIMKERFNLNLSKPGLSHRFAKIKQLATDDYNKKREK